MAAAFNDGEFKNQYIESLHNALLGKKQIIKQKEIF